MGFVIKNGNICEAQKITLTPTQRKNLQQTTETQKEIIKRMKRRKLLRAQNSSLAMT